MGEAERYDVLKGERATELCLLDWLRMGLGGVDIVKG